MPNKEMLSENNGIRYGFRKQISELPSPVTVTAFDAYFINLFITPTAANGKHSRQH